MRFFVVENLPPTFHCVWLHGCLGSGESEVREAIMEGLTAGEEERKGEREGGETEVTEMVKVSSSLNYFELKLFKDEPPLVRFHFSSLSKINYLGL